MRWYAPSWNGDVRFESDGAKTKLTIIAPTQGELLRLVDLHRALRKHLDAQHRETLWPSDTAADGTHEVLIDAPMSKVGPTILKHLKSGAQTLSAIAIKGDALEIVEGTGAALQAAVEQVESKDGDAVTVKRPTPCCPKCVPGAIEPANEVLQAFLSPQQHDAWARYRAFEVRGGITGFRYLLAHRHSATAQKIGRIAYDLDHSRVVHFHDWSVPPEEEVLAAKLILEHREPWLRNEATLWGKDVDDARMLRFKNPFGDYRDGIPDSILTSTIGGMFWGVVRDPLELAELLREQIAQEAA